MRLSSYIDATYHTVEALAKVTIDGELDPAVISMNSGVALRVFCKNEPK